MRLGVVIWEGAAAQQVAQVARVAVRGEQVVTAVATVARVEENTVEARVVARGVVVMGAVRVVPKAGVARVVAVMAVAAVAVGAKETKEEAEEAKVEVAMAVAVTAAAREEMSVSAKS